MLIVSCITEKKYCRHDNSWKLITMTTTSIVNKDQCNSERSVLTIDFILIKKYFRNNTSLKDLALRSQTLASTIFVFKFKIRGTQQNTQISRYCFLNAWFFWSTISDLILWSFITVMPLLPIFSC